LSFCLLSRSLPSLCLVLTLTSTCLISTLVLHDALPICPRRGEVASWSSRPMPRKYGPCPVLKSVMPWPLFCLRCALGAPHDDPLLLVDGKSFMTPMRRVGVVSRPTVPVWWQS